MRQTKRMRLLEMEHCGEGQNLRDLLFRLYWVERKSMVVIGVELGIPTQTVSAWMRRLEISRDHFAEQHARSLAS